MAQHAQEQLHPLITSFLSESSTQVTLDSQNSDLPNYWTSKLSSLLTTSNLHSVNLGTGNRILESLLPAIEAAQTEVLFITCYWAQSDSQSRICDSLRKLSAKGIASNRKIRVRICFSSSGLWQKLFHPQGRGGKIYTPAKWSKALGLPSPEELEGLDLQIKSVFFLPISIIHPKFVVIDRKKAFLPSCNVSWEEWFEGCVELEGEVVPQFVRFWEEFWADERDRVDSQQAIHAGTPRDGAGTIPSPTPSAGLLNTLRVQPSTSIQTLFLPSPHHRNPQFRLPWQSAPSAPLTPLNIFLLQAFSTAHSNIYIQTPNLTSQPVINALLSACKRGVNVRIVTSERLQLLEQIITAGTTSPKCVAKLISQHAAIARERSDARFESADVEAMAAPSLGKLEVSYYKPQSEKEGSPDEPVQSHFKLTVVDGEFAVFGSGNMDRPSWYTSQELGVAFFDRGFVAKVEAGLEEALKGRRKVAYQG